MKSNQNHDAQGKFATRSNTTDILNFHDMSLEQQRVIKQFLDGKPVIELTGDEFKKSNRKLTDMVTEFYKDKYGGKATHPVVGNVELNEQGVQDSIAHGIGRAKSAAFAAVSEIINKGAIVSKETNWKGRNYDSYLIAAPFKMAGEEYIATVVIIKNPKMQRYYLHEVAKKEELRSAFKTGAISQTGRTTGAHGVPSIFTIPHDILNFNKSLSIRHLPKLLKSKSTTYQVKDTRPK